MKGLLHAEDQEESVGKRFNRSWTIDTGLEDEMTKIATSLRIVSMIIALAAMVACSPMGSRETRQWEPAPATDFKSVAGKWEGLLVRNPKTPNDDWVTLVIGDNGTYEFASYRTIGVFAGKGKLTLTDGKLSAKSDKSGQMTLQPYVDRASNDRMLKVDAKDSGGYTYAAELKRTGDSGAAK